MRRTVAFVDYDGICRTGHQTFAPASDDSPRQVDPLRLGMALARQSGPDRELIETRVYRAVPTGRVDPAAFSTVLEQMDRWAAAGAVVVRRPLSSPEQYRRDRDRPIAAGGHKGLAVAMAIDLVVLAWRDRYDLAVICSNDEDLAPAVRAVLAQTWKNVEVASWRSPRQPLTCLSVSGEHVTHLWLDEDLYDMVVEPSN